MQDRDTCYADMKVIDYGHAACLGFLPDLPSPIRAYAIGWLGRKVPSKGQMDQTSIAALCLAHAKQGTGESSVTASVASVAAIGTAESLSCRRTAGHMFCRAWCSITSKLTTTCRQRSSCRTLEPGGSSKSRRQQPWPSIWAIRSS